MAEPPKDRPPSWRERWVAKLDNGRKLTWSWLTDPAVLVYRRHGFGQKRVRAAIVEFFLFLREVIREFWNIEGTSRAASLAYTTLLSLFPLVVAFTTVLDNLFRQAFGSVSGRIDQVLNSVIPYESPQIAYHLQRFRANQEAASTVGVIFFMLIAFRLFLAVEGAVNQIWKVRSARGYKQKIIAFTMLFFWGPLLMGLSFTTTTMLERSSLNVLLQGDFLFTAVPIVVLFVGFTMLFWLVPSTRVRLSAAMIGALLTTVLFALIRWGFGVYADALLNGSMNYIYGAVGLGLIFLLAIEVMWVVVLLGVEISYVWQNLYGVLRATEQQVEDLPQFDLYFGLRGLLEVARRFERREEPPSSYRLAEQFGTTDSQMLRVLRKLEDAKLVMPTSGSEWVGFVPACDPDRISIDEVITQMEGVQRVLPDIGPDDRERAAIGDLFQKLNQCSIDALDRMSVGRLVRELYTPRVARTDDRVTL